MPKRYLLLQARNQDDPIRLQEIECFTQALDCSVDQIKTSDLLTAAPSDEELDAVDTVLIGGSGDYSVVVGGPWLDSTMDLMRRLYRQAKPTFASCWGFQAMARALGGEVITNLPQAELGSLPVQLTDAGRDDPVFGLLEEPFLAFMGHQDIVTRLPEDAILLASTDRVTNQAFRFAGKPIYCTQFHPELYLQAFIDRIAAYPQYVERIAGVTLERFVKDCHEAPAAGTLLSRFVKFQVGHSS